MPRPRRLKTSGYGFEKVEHPGALLPWSRVEELLSNAQNYWVVTASTTGRPHAAPVWAIWDDGTLLFSTSASSRKAVNLQHNPQVLVHLDHDEAAVIVEGTAEVVIDAGAKTRFARACEAKYEWDGDYDELLADPANYVYAVLPKLAFSFADMDTTATRWEF